MHMSQVTLTRFRITAYTSLSFVSSIGETAASGHIQMLQKSITPEVVSFVVWLCCISRAHSRGRLQKRRDCIHHVCSVQLRPRPILQPEAPAVCTV